jgi:hypothetical protein
MSQGLGGGALTGNSEVFRHPTREPDYDLTTFLAMTVADGTSGAEERATQHPPPGKRPLRWFEIKKWLRSGGAWGAGGGGLCETEGVAPSNPNRRSQIFLH